MKKFQWFLIIIAATVVSCSNSALSTATPLGQESVILPTISVIDEAMNSPLVTFTPIVTKIAIETSTPIPPGPTPEIIPTLSGPFPPGPRVVYSENIHDGTVTFWVASPTNPTYRLPLAKGFDPNDFGTHDALSPNGKLIAYIALPELNYHNRFGANLWLVTADGKEQRLLAKGVDIGGPGYPYWSPDSRYIAFVRSLTRSTETEDIDEATVWMIDVITGEETMVEHPITSDSNRKYAWPIGWRSDGAGFYYRSQGNIYFFSKQTNTSTFVITLPAFTNRCKLSPDSTQILCSVLTDRKKAIYQLIILSLNGIEGPKMIREFQGEYFTFIWGPYNRAITISENLPTAENTIWQIIDSDTNSVIDVKLQTAGKYFPQSWSTDGKWLATQSVSESHGDLYFFSANGQTVNHLPTQGATDVLGWLMADLP